MGERRREREAARELLMALLLSLSAHCDSQNQLLTRTTSFQSRRRRGRQCTGRWGGAEGRGMEGR